MELICYRFPGWTPLIRPAEATREWMTATPESFAYRCLPLNIANAHGWEVLSPCAFDARWDGTTSEDAVTIRVTSGDTQNPPVSIFGQGVLTFHVPALFRTPVGWSLWAGGSPNRFKDGIAPLTGVIETDWSPFTFTMNWRFTRPHNWVHFDEQEPICFIFPVQRRYLEEVKPRVAPMNDEPELVDKFKAWSKARNDFQARMKRETPKAGSDKWQKHYYRGTDVSGKVHTDDHVTKLRLAPFEGAPPIPPLSPAKSDAVPASEATAQQPTGGDLQSSLVFKTLMKREWLLDAVETQRQLSPAASHIRRIKGLTGEQFLERFYAAHRPVILTDEMASWPALTKWSPDYLRNKVGPKVIEYQGGRTKSERFEMYKDAHRKQMPFDEYMDLITQNPGNDAYITAYNSTRNAEALSVLHEDLRHHDKFLDGDPARRHGMMWIGPEGTVTSLHHDLTNNLIAQIVGRKRIKLIPPADTLKMYNHKYVFSMIPDLDDPNIDLAKYPLLSAARIYDVTLGPGEMLFVPFAWWHQVKALDFSVTITYTNFHWPNGMAATYPAD
jgi:hypothetical protein